MSLVSTETKTLARFRYAFRKLLRSTDEAAAEYGVTPQQHQLLLGVVGFTGDGWATIGDLAEFLQLRHHSVVGLVDRAVEADLVRREPNPENRREIEVHLTDRGGRIVRALNQRHRKELAALRRTLNVYILEREGEVVFRPKTRKAPAAGKRQMRGR